MSERVIVHDRVGVKGQHVPVVEESMRDIPEDLYEELDRVKANVTELENARYELGRLMQIVQHLTNVCNTAEKNAAEAKRAIIESMDLGDGNYAIDFNKKQIGLVEPTPKTTPRVV